MAFDHVDTFLACMSENSPSNFEVRIINSFTGASHIVGFDTLEEAEQRLEDLEFFEEGELLCDHPSTETSIRPGYGTDEPYAEEVCTRCGKVIGSELSAVLAAQVLNDDDVPF